MYSNWKYKSFLYTLVTIFIVYIVIPIVNVLVSQQNFEIKKGNIPDFYSISKSLSISQLPIILFLIIIGLFTFKEIKIKDKFQLINWNNKYLLLPPVAEAILLPATFLSVFIFQNILDMLNIKATPQDFQVMLLHCDTNSFILLSIAAIVVAPIIEEIIFRKLLYDYLSLKFGFVLSAFVVGILFAGVHFALLQFPALFIMSIILQLTYKKFNSIYPCILIHSFHNSTSIFFISLVKFGIINASEGKI